MENFNFKWDYDFSTFRPWHHEKVSEDEVIEYLESDTTSFYHVPNSHHSEIRFFCINYINKKFIFVVFNYFTYEIIIEHARFATKREIERYFDF